MTPPDFPPGTHRHTGLSAHGLPLRPRPRRLRVAGDLFHPRLPAGAVYVGRAAPGLKRSPFHNPFRVGRPVAAGSTELVANRAHAVELYRAWISEQGEDYRNRIRAELGGRDLACWCPLTDSCHADVLLALANP